MSILGGPLLEDADIEDGISSGPMAMSIPQRVHVATPMGH